MLRRWLSRAWSSLLSLFHASSTRPLAALPSAPPANDVEVDVDLTDLLPAIERARDAPESSGVRIAAMAETTIFEDIDEAELEADATPSERATPTCAPALELFEANEEPRASLRPTRRVRLARIAAALSKAGNG